MGLLASVGRISFGLDQLFGPGWSRSMNLPPRLLLRSRRGSQGVLDNPIKGCKMIEFQLEVQAVQVMPHLPKMIGRPRQLLSLSGHLADATLTRPSLVFSSSVLP